MKVLIKDALLDYPGRSVKITFLSLEDYETVLRCLNRDDLLTRFSIVFFKHSAILQTDPFIKIKFNTSYDAKGFMINNIKVSKIFDDFVNYSAYLYFPEPEFEIRSLSDFGGETFTATIDDGLSRNEVRKIMGLEPVKLDTSKKEELKAKYEAERNDAIDTFAYCIERAKEDRKMLHMNMRIKYMDCIQGISDASSIIKKIQINEKKEVVTIVWIDGEVTMAKCGPNDIFDPEKGLAIAFMKRFFPSGTQMNKWMKEQTAAYYLEEAE